MSEAQAIEASLAAGRPPATVASLTDEFKALGLPTRRPLIVHTAMSRLGYVIGGAQTVIQALLAALGPEGTLVMPTFSGDRGEPEPWQNPPVPETWWPLFREHMPAFHPGETPTRSMGVVAETFRRWPGSLRSSHPSNSLAAYGPLAEAITADHSLAHGLGERSPVARVYEHDGQVLLLGVNHGNNSSLHLAEQRARGIRVPFSGGAAPVFVDGVRQWVRYDDAFSHGEDFEALGEAFAATGAETRGSVGLATARLCSQRAVVDFGTRWLEVNRKA